MSEPVPDAPMTEQEAPPTRKRKRRMSKGRWIGLGAIVLVLAAGVTTWLLLQPQPTAGAQTRTRTFTVEKGTQTVTVGLTGTLSPQTQSSLNFGVSGTVTDVYVSAGDTVKKGAKLARVDDDDLQDALELAKANLETARANLDDVEDDGTDAAVTAAEAQVKSAKAAVASAEDDLDSAVLRATISGTVASVDLTVGDTVTGVGSSGQGGGQNTADATTAQVVVVSTSAWQLDATVGSADLASLKAGQAVTVLPDGATEPVNGTVASVGIVATSTTDGSATFPVVVNLEGKHPELYSGTTATGTVTVGEYPDVLTVATMAITTSDGRSVVTRVAGDEVEEVEVTIGRVFGEATEITAGLAEGDTVQVSFTIARPADATEDGGLFGGGFSGPGGGAAPPEGGVPPGGGQAPAGTQTSGGGR